MKKHTFKILSLCLSLMLMLSSLPMNIFAAVDTGVTVETDLSKVPNLNSIIADEEKNIVLGYTLDAKGTAGTYSVDQTYGDVVNQNVNHSVSDKTVITNGTIDSTHMDIYSFKQVPAQGEWVEGYVDLTFSFLYEAEITNLLVASSAQVKLRTQAYEVYASDDIDSLYSESNKLIAYENGVNNDHSAQYITFSETIKATYFGIRITKAVWDKLDESYDYSYVRLREIAIIGSCDVPEVLKIVDGNSANKCIADLKTDYNLLQSGYITQNQDLPASVRYTGSNMGNPVSGGITTNSTGGKGNEMIDGDVATNADADLKITYYDDATKEFYPNSYQDVTFVLANEASIDKIFLAHRNDVKLMAKEYEIYVGNTYEDLYTEANRKWAYVNETNAQFQTFQFKNPVDAKYVGIRFRKPVTFPQWNDGNMKVAYAYIRLSEIAIFGEYKAEPIDPSELAEIISIENANACIENLKTIDNLLQSGYTARNEDIPSSIRITGSNRGASGTGNIHSYKNDNDLIDGDVSTHADVNAKVTFYDETTKAFYENSYQDITFVLRNEATIDKIFLSQRTEAGHKAKEYEIYTANSYEELYNTENRHWIYINDTNARYQTFTFKTPVVAKYVGIRVRKPVTFPAWTLGVGSAYLRLTEIAIFGKYNVPYYDYSVTTNKGDFVNDSGNIYMGEEFDYVLPLVKDGYTFDHLEINGTTAECEIDPARNIVSFGFKLESDMNVVAVYGDDPTTLTPKKFKVKDGKVALPINSIAWEARQGFEEYPTNIAIKDGEVFYKNGEWIKDGMKLVLFAGDKIAEELDIVPQFDYNDDGDVNVTDITAAIDGILGNEITDHGKFVFDANLSNTLTVSDVIKARNDILTRANGTSDYTTRESNMKDFKFKSMGRTILNEDNSLFFENAASGILFNLDCYGDVVATLMQRVRNLLITP